MTFQDLLAHFGLSDHPFARQVPQAGLFNHKSFVEARTRVSLALESRTPGMLIAEPGLGKSTLLGAIADDMDGARMRITYTALCSGSPFGFLGQLAPRYGQKAGRSAAQTAQRLLEELSLSDRKEVLVLDEAHRLPPTTLDELRLLSNLDFDRLPPFALLLVGQPPLRQALASPELASLRQRIAIRATLSPLTEEETAEYIDRRLRAVGARATIFRAGAAAKVFEFAQGVPREIGNLSTSALMVAAAAGKKHVDATAVEDAHFDRENS